MATTQPNLQPDKKPGGFFGFLKTSYRLSMDASESMTYTAIDLPFDILEGIGVPADKTQGFKNFNHKLVGGVYRGMDKATSTIAGAAAAPAKWLETGMHKLRPGSGKPKEALAAGKPMEAMAAAVEEAKPAMTKAKAKVRTTKRKVKAKAKAARPKRRAMSGKAKASKKVAKA